MSLCAEKHQNAVHPSGPSKKAAPRGRAPGNAKDGSSYDQLFDEAFDSHMDEDLVLTDPDRAPFCLVWRNLTFVIKGKSKSLIDGLTGFARSGRVMSIMGPVGAGGCALLRALAHRSSHGSTIGEILIGKRDLSLFDVAFVPEIDEINPNLTVFEQIEMIGLLKCSNSRAMYLRLTTILRVTGMVKKATVRCGALSRVHLKRVGVAMGLISNPSVLALERPITTLDNVAAVTLVQMLTDLAHSLNVAVVMTVHRPSSMVFELLQDLYILGAGKLAYSGPATCVRQYFRDLGYLCPPKTSLCDFTVDILSRPPVYQTEPWQLIYFQSNFGRNMRIRIAVCDQSSTGTHSPNYPPSWSNRLSHMTVFFLKYYVRDRSFYLFRVLCLGLVSFFYGTLFFGLSPQTSKLSFYRGAIVHTTWIVLLSVVLSSRLFVRDRKHSLELIKSASCRVDMYCAAQFIASIPFNMTAAITFQLPFYFLSKLNPSFFVLIYTALVSCGHMIFVEAVMLCAIQLFKNAILSAKVVVFVLVLQYLFSGYFISVVDTPAWVRWICFLVPTRYSFDGYLYIILDTQRFEVSASPSLKMTGGEVLVAIHTDPDVDPYNSLLILCCWILLVRVCHYLMLLKQMWPNLPSRSKKPDRRTLPCEGTQRCSRMYMYAPLIFS
jgi:ABC-type multidrug transport system ATPase subunit